MPATATAVRTSGEIAALPERPCPYCRVELARDARKCRACGEWVVSTSHGMAAAALRLLAWAWGGLTLLAAAALWSAGQRVRRELLLRAFDPIITPLLVEGAVFALVVVVLLAGLTASATLAVLARSTPRRPRWWT